MIHLGIIGLGTIFQKQQLVLKRMSDHYIVEAVCDSDRRKLREWRSSIGYLSADEFLRNEKIEAVLIATPPQTHFELARKCLCAGKHILLEKPAVLSMEELEKLYAIAGERERLLHVAYHAAFASDLLWYLKNKDRLNKEYHLGELQHITCGFFDPYMENGRILPQKLSICGSFLDSGVNELSVCAKLISLDNVTWKSQEEHRTIPQDFRTTYKSYSTYQADNCKISLETGFHRKKNHKETVLAFEGGDRKLILDHSEQSVFFREKTGEQITLWKAEKSNRLEVQYEGVFKEFYAALEEKKDNKEETIRIHRLLLGH